MAERGIGPGLDLTARERDVVRLMAAGRTNGEIAEALGITFATAKWHVSAIIGKLGVSTRDEAVAEWRRRQKRLPARLRRRFAFIPHAATLRIAIAIGGSIGAVGVAAAVVIAVRDGGDETPGPPAISTAVTSLDPARAMADQVVAIARAGALPAFRQLMRASSSPCLAFAGNGFAAPCPAGVPNGTQVDFFPAVSDGGAVTAGDLDALLARSVPVYTGLFALTRSQDDRLGAFIPTSRFEVVAYGGRPFLRAAVYFVDEGGIVGMYEAGLEVIDQRLDSVPADDWVIVRGGTASFASDKRTYVVGRDDAIQFTVITPRACNGLDLTMRLYVRPEPGVQGGVQSISEPGLQSEVHTPASTSGTTRMTFVLPQAISGPMWVEAGLSAYCLNETAFSNASLQLAIPAPPEDAQIATIELLGKSLDLANGHGGTHADSLGRSLTATIAGVACATVSLLDSAPRNARGNIVVRLGTPDQPAACRAPGQQISFVQPSGAGTFEKPLYIAGAVQLVSQIGPDAIVN
jgi:DNA-binding CsgD family transcriptional regulator